MHLKPANEYMRVNFCEFGEMRGTIHYEKTSNFDLSRLQSDSLLFTGLLLGGGIEFSDIQKHNSGAVDPGALGGLSQGSGGWGELLIIQEIDEDGQIISTDAEISREYNNWATCVGILAEICLRSGLIAIPAIVSDAIGSAINEPLIKVSDLDLGVPKSWSRYPQRVVMFQDDSERTADWNFACSPGTGHFASAGLLFSVMSNILSSYYEEEDEAPDVDIDILGSNILDEEIELNKVLDSGSSLNARRAIVLLGAAENSKRSPRFGAASGSVQENEIVYAARTALMELMS